MAWQAIYQDAVKRSGGIAFSIVYTDGTVKVLREYTVSDLSDAIVQQIARTEVAQLSASPLPSVVTIPSGSVIDLTPPVAPADPDPAKTQFAADYRLLAQMQRGVSAGVIAANDPILASLLSKTQGEYKASYVGLL